MRSRLGERGEGLTPIGREGGTVVRHQAIFSFAGDTEGECGRDLRGSLPNQVGRTCLVAHLRRKFIVEYTGQG